MRRDPKVEDADQRADSDRECTRNAQGRRFEDVRAFGARRTLIVLRSEVYANCG